jgi:hypothetical protein
MPEKISSGDGLRDALRRNAGAQHRMRLTGRTSPIHYGTRLKVTRPAPPGIARCGRRRAARRRTARGHRRRRPSATRTTPRAAASAAAPSARPQRRRREPRSTHPWEQRHPPGERRLPPVRQPAHCAAFWPARLPQPSAPVRPRQPVSPRGWPMTRPARLRIWPLALPRALSQAWLRPLARPVPQPRGPRFGSSMTGSTCSFAGIAVTPCRRAARWSNARYNPSGRPIGSRCAVHRLGLAKMQAKQLLISRPPRSPTARPRVLTSGSFE